eukprot:TRINITY_DN71504_c0_g1_i1.p1 TRINITY_DN71504_c0_g1~~TRINITY_DN71504_c0_g1_i1.p1  ORF type:complete len:263 (+),score=50.81 TRINITY_DN71504_c0_g1_i1:35-823(+)
MALQKLADRLFAPCFDCCGEEKGRLKGPRLPKMHARGTEVEVELAVSPLAGMRGAAGYHTSVLLGGEEFYFGPFGISCNYKLSSHGSGEVTRMTVGYSDLTGKEILASLSDDFSPGSYDLLRKNCNAFTDAALCLLCCKRLDPGFTAVETLGQMAASAGLLRTLTLGAYTPNEKADGFDLEAVIERISLAAGERRAGHERIRSFDPKDPSFDELSEFSEQCVIAKIPDALEKGLGEEAVSIKDLTLRAKPLDPSEDVIKEDT